MLEHLSYSSITLYLDCPEAWRRKYIAQEPTKSSPALVFGSAFHGAVEAYLKEAGPGKPVDFWAAAWAQANERAEGAWELETPEPHYNEGLRILGQPIVEAAVKALTVRSDDQGLLIERKVELHVPGVPIPVIGYIDLVTADGVPCDLKTSKASWPEAKASDSLQGLFYLAALNQAGQHWHGWRFRHVVFVKTKEPKVQALQTAHRPGEIFFLFRLIKDVWQCIERAAFPVNPTSWKCSPQYCDFWAKCRGRYV